MLKSHTWLVATISESAIWNISTLLGSSPEQPAAWCFSFMHLGKEQSHCPHHHPVPKASLGQHDPDLSLFPCCQLCPVSRSVARALTTEMQRDNEIWVLRMHAWASPHTHTGSPTGELQHLRLPARAPGKEQVLPVSAWYFTWKRVTFSSPRYVMVNRPWKQASTNL